MLLLRGMVLLSTEKNLDLSYAAAKVIDMIALDIAIVRIEYIGMYTEYFKAVRDIFKTAH